MRENVSAQVGMRPCARIALLAACLLAPAAVAGAEVRQPSEAERAAVSVIAGFLARGPQAVVDRLASNSPLRKLRPADALADIEARMGPPAGSRWELQTVVPALKDKCAAFSVAFPSGVDDNVFLDLTSEGGNVRIVNVRTLAEPANIAPLFAPRSDSAPVPTPDDQSRNGLTAASRGMIGSAVLVLFGIYLLFRARIAGRIVLAAGLLTGCAAFVVAIWSANLLTTDTAPASGKPAQNRGLATLVALRRTIAAGGGGALPWTPSIGEAANVAALWKAQGDFVQMRLDDVKKTLDKYPHPSNVPMVELLRARLALVQNEPDHAVVAYQNAINLGPGRDGLLIEAAAALFNGGDDDLGAAMLRRAADSGTRNALVYYSQAVEALAKNQPDNSEAQFKKAWTLQPAERRQLVGTGLLSMILRQKEGALVSLSTPGEATFADAGVSTRSILLPPTAIARVSGALLEIEVGDATLLVPGGAAMAPMNVTVVDAGAWERIGEDQALARLPELMRDAAQPGAYMQPVLRGRITKAAQSLYTRNRWTELAALTAGVDPKWQFIDAGLVLLRAESLRRLAREPEGKQIVVALARSSIVERRKDPMTFEALGEALASYDEFDAALVMFSKANALQTAHPVDAIRLEQVSMNRTLAKTYSIYDSPHFRVHYPPAAVAINAIAVAQILEAELRRLQQWVPVENFKPVVVNIVPWSEFRTIYAGGGDILGFYDRAITVPLADIQQLEPAVTAIVTHELCHAMIAQATHDQAPHWFHEGLAQRVEMVEYSSNAFNTYDDSKLFAISVLDPVLTHAQDPGMIADAYIVSQTFIRYIESVYGDRGIKQLLASFAAGATTDDALQSLTGTPTATVDANFRNWGRSERRVFQNPPPILYELSGQQLMKVIEETPRRLQGGTLRNGRGH
jgi:tetratricopeptide (TPR) repeat protein